jgi:hypothetical protein
MRGISSNGKECSPQCMKVGDNWLVCDKMNKDRDGGIEMNKPPGGRWHAAVELKSYVPRNESLCSINRCAFVVFEASND